MLVHELQGLFAIPQDLKNGALSQFFERVAEQAHIRSDILNHDDSGWLLYGVSIR
jgi:hypothetical protein